MSTFKHGNGALKKGIAKTHRSLQAMIPCCCCCCDSFLLLLLLVVVDVVAVVVVAAAAVVVVVDPIQECGGV